MRKSSKSLARVSSLPALCVGAITVAAVAGAPAAPLPPVAAPYENPGNEAQRVLGKMLFFEEQLSSDGTVSCATCHVMTTGGVDPRRSRNPGKNGVFGDLGDIMGSPGVPSLGADGMLAPSKDFGTTAQVTPRTAPTPFTAMYQDRLLWDGRAGSKFVDPVTLTVAIQSGGALESQALLPLTNSVEMGHAGRRIEEIPAKLAAARPLALAGDVPADVKDALSGDPTYAELFRRAYGDDAITPARVAMAIATYERTLVAGNTKYDRFIAGDATAMSPDEVRGLEALQNAQCTKCHAPPLFTDGSFRTTGVRGPFEDLGLAGVTNNMADRGKFKVPTLRNVALKPSFFHDGQRTRLEEAIDFYSAFEVPVVNGVRHYGSPTGSQAPVPHEQIVDNQDPILETIKLTPQTAQDILTFLRGALVDERVVNGDFPFDTATLGTQRDDLPVIRTEPNAEGRSLATPDIQTRGPAVAGNTDFAVTAFGGREGDVARLVAWFDPMEDTAVTVSDPVRFQNANGTTLASAKVSLAGARPGSRLRYAWRISDPLVKNFSTTSRIDGFTVGRPRPVYESGEAFDAQADHDVSGKDAFVESAKFSVDYTRPNYVPASDSFTITVRLDRAASAADLSAGRVSLTIGGVAVLTGAPLDAAGAIASPTATGRYDRATGRLVLAARGVDLSAAILTAASVPVTVELNGLALASPAASTTLAFVPKARDQKPTTGRFDYRKGGTGNGVFHVVTTKTTPTSDGRYRVRLTAALDAPGAFGSWTSGSVAFTAGSHDEIQASQDLLQIAPNGSWYALTPTGDLARLRIDIVHRTVSADFTIALPELAAAAPGATVEVPLTLRTKPAGGAGEITYRTNAVVAK